MEEIQEEYGSVAKWAELTDGSKGEANAKAIIFGYTAMQTGKRRKINKKPLRRWSLITNIVGATTTIIKSTKNEKNASIPGDFSWYALGFLKAPYIFEISQIL